MQIPDRKSYSHLGATKLLKFLLRNYEGPVLFVSPGQFMIAIDPSKDIEGEHERLDRMKKPWQI